ncbi:MAG: XTP/dITP diphosphatase [Deltaproteobacteria bacterium]|nr:XTP/dITP diphosphatase [Deltaproteobacteria bacterium]
MDIILATKNKGKVRELERLLADLDINILPMTDFPEVGHIEESGETFEENALIKAREVAKITGHIAMADDSGLAVDALDGRPGVYSARYAGLGAGDEANNRKLIEDLKGVSGDKRSAAFICCMAVAGPSGKSMTAHGKCEGLIRDVPSGNGGFGYDPLFYVEDYRCTMAELSPDVKNQISHRGRAVAELKKRLPAFLDSLT